MSGLSRGQCTCGVCKCNSGFTGDSCDCSIDKSPCMYNDVSILRFLKKNYFVYVYCRYYIVSTVYMVTHKKAYQISMVNCIFLISNQNFIIRLNSRSNSYHSQILNTQHFYETIIPKNYVKLLYIFKNKFLNNM